MKLEVGMYVRTNEGIKKIEDYNYHEELPDNPYDFNKHHIYKQNIIKASHNIIDLIEDGDYVNGKRIEVIGKYSEDNPKIQWIAYDKIDNFGDSYMYKIYQIQPNDEVLTKEQYEANVYRVEELR